MFLKVLFFCVRSLLSLRYRVKVEGVEHIRTLIEKGDKGSLILPNHPSEMDPVLIMVYLGAIPSPRPVIVDSFYHDFYRLMHYLKAIPIPNFDTGSNSYKQFKLKQAKDEIERAVIGKEALLSYPAGQLKRSGQEKLGGKSLLQEILEGKEEKPHIILVRTEGMWGSAFSTAKDGKTPNFGKAALEGIKAVLLNGIFFMPKREIRITFEEAKNFPSEGSKEEQNAYLEAWYNQYHLAQGVVDKEPIQDVSYFFWKKTKLLRKAKKEDKVNLEHIPKELYDSILQEIAEITKKSSKALNPKQHLAHDLHMDSLDVAELISYLEQNYHVRDIRPDELSDIRSVLGYASKQIQPKREWMNSAPPALSWKREKRFDSLSIPEKDNLAEAFVQTCITYQGKYACADAVYGPLKYENLLFRATLLSLCFSEDIKERYVGVMLPSTTACYAVILALLLAGKIPVMLNWTVGVRNLESMLKTGNVQTVISSHNFLMALPGVQIDPVHDKLYLLEDLKKKVSLKRIVEAKLLVRKPEALIKKLRRHACSKEEPAVILFTSGTENYPKGVPLSHKNILANLNSCLSSFDVHPQDIMYGILPPFHSFGFAITGLFPLIAGVKVAYSPNPTHGARLAQGVRKWGISFLCLAPTFLRGILRAGNTSLLKSLRFVITGAEKLPEDVKALFEEVMQGKGTLLEGYGTTECAPVVSVNPMKGKSVGIGKPLVGVQVAIVDPETHEKCKQGEKGLLLVHGDNIFSGYIGKDNAETFVSLEGKRWYNTGDLAYLDEEGYLILVGRLKRFVKIGGEMVSLPAIESVLVQKSIEERWPIDSETPSFVVMESEGKNKTQLALVTSYPLELQEVNGYLKQAGFSNLVKIHRVFPVKAIPILATGKVHFREVKKILEENSKD